MLSLLSPQFARHPQRSVWVASPNRPRCSFIDHCFRGCMLARHSFRPCGTWRPWRACRSPSSSHAARQRHERLRASSQGVEEGGTQLSPREALLEALREQGLPPSAVRVAGPAPAEEDDDEETWEDVLAEGEDPWMRDPVALEEDALTAAGLLLPEGDDARSQAASAYEAQPLPSMSWTDFQQLQQAEAQQAGRGGEGGWAVLDVRKEGDEEPSPPPGSLRLPLERLTREAVGALQCSRLAVLLTEDLRGQQACVRLRNVYGYREAVLLLAWEEAGKAGRGQ